jgi:superfamily II RNA helicase
MAGRAGRRGKDTTGFSIITLDRAFGKIPRKEDFDNLLENKGTPLESKLKLSYQMTLNVMKSDDVQISDLLKKSFFENESEKERAYATASAQQMQLKIQKAQHIECIHGVPEQIYQYFEFYE